MSGDVQPRKRKDRRRKRDLNDSKTDGETAFSRQPSIQEDDESSHGVHLTKMGSDDVHLHVQHDHGTGGHWCAKVFFFSLLIVLLGLVALIIMENRGISDVDTPLSESRFSNYFDGWVEEHRDDHEHDEHDSIQASIEEHDEHDEPFEEEEDHSQDDHDDEDHDDEEDDDDNQTVEEEDDDGDDNQTVEEEEDEDADDNQTVEEAEDEDDNEDDDDDDNEDDNQTAEDDGSHINQTVEDDDDDNDDDNDDDEDDGDNQTVEDVQQEDNDDDDDNDNDDDNDDEPQGDTQEDEVSQQDDDPFDEDGTFESLEKVVENDAEELLLLQEKARQQATENPAANDDDDDKDNDDDAAPSWASSLAVKIGVGVALALVARHVLIRKNPNTTEPDPEILMKRRLTIASEEETFPDVEDVPDLPNEDEYSEEEIEIEEEIEEEIIEEYIDSDNEHDNGNANAADAHVQSRYVPETFEQLNAMYRPSVSQATPPKKEENTREPSPIVAPTLKKEPPMPLDDPSPSKDTASSVKAWIEQQEPPNASTEEPDEISDEDEDELDDIDDDDDEEDDDENEDEDLLDDISDVDDSDLMNRLEAKYGRLPAKEFESDEDAEDPSWIRNY